MAKLQLGAGPLLGALTLVGACSSSNDPPAPPVHDMTGHWMTWFTDPTTTEESGPAGSFLIQNGAAFDGILVSGSASGTSFSVNATLPGLPNALVLQGTTDGTTAQGTYSLTGFPVSSTFRMQKFTPTGTLTVNGTVGGEAVAISGGLAFGRRGYSDPGLTTLTQVELVVDDGTTRFELQFPTPAGLAVGTLNVPGLPVSAYRQDDLGSQSLTATGGTVTVSQYDAGGFAGTFNLTLSGGETVTGSFTVAFDIDAYDT